MSTQRRSILKQENCCWELDPPMDLGMGRIQSHMPEKAAIITESIFRATREKLGLILTSTTGLSPITDLSRRSCFNEKWIVHGWAFPVPMYLARLVRQETLGHYYELFEEPQTDQPTARFMKVHLKPASKGEFTILESVTLDISKRQIVNCIMFSMQIRRLLDKWSNFTQGLSKV